MSITVGELSKELTFGAIVEGVTRETLADPLIRAQLNAVFVDRGVIVFEDVEPSSTLQVAISEVFGPLKEHPTKTTPRDDAATDLAPGVIDMHYRPTDDPSNLDGLVEIDGTILARYSPWHFDHCYNDELNRAGVLRSPIIAPERGRTGFADGIDLYDRLPAKMRAALEDLNIIYTLDTRLTKMRFGVDFKAKTEAPYMRDLLQEAARFPRAMHPAIWTRDTGEKVLHIGPWMAVGIEHHEDAHGDAFFDEVCHTINRLCARGVYWHDWKPTQMLIWDNWRMLHAVEGCEAKYERRTLRTTIKGDYGFGYFEGGKKIGEVHREIAM